MNERAVARQVLGAIALFALVSTVSDSVIKAAHGETLDYLYQKIKDAGAAMGQIVGITTPATYARPAVELSLAGDTVIPDGWTLGLPGFGAVQMALAELSGAASAADGAGDQPAQASFAGGNGNAGGGIFFINYGGASASLPGSASLSSRAQLFRALPEFPAPLLLPDAQGTLLKPLAALKKLVTAKPCPAADVASGAASGPAADPAASACAEGEAAQMTTLLGDGDALWYAAADGSSSAGGESGSSGESFTAYSIATSAAAAGRTLTTPSVTTAGVGGTTVTAGTPVTTVTAGLPVTAVSSPPPWALLGLGCGGMLFWVSRRRRTV